MNSRSYYFLSPARIFILTLKCVVKVYVYHGLFDLLPQFFESEDASLEIASALRFTLRLPEACQGGGCEGPAFILVISALLRLLIQV